MRTIQIKGVLENVSVSLERRMKGMRIHGHRVPNGVSVSWTHENVNVTMPKQVRGEWDQKDDEEYGDLWLENGTIIGYVFAKQIKVL